MKRNPWERKYLAELTFVRNIKSISNVGLIGQRLIPNMNLKLKKETSRQKTAF